MQKRETHDYIVRQIILLMKDNSDAVGFIPQGEIEKALSEGRIYHQRENGEWVGYLLRGPIRPYEPVYIYQECMDKDARRIGSGRKCFEQLLYEAIALDASAIKLRCAEDLPSNWFWMAMGFKKIGEDKTPNYRDRLVFYYERTLKPTLFEPQIPDVRGAI